MFQLNSDYLLSMICVVLTGSVVLFLSWIWVHWWLCVKAYKYKEGSIVSKMEAGWKFHVRRCSTLSSSSVPVLLQQFSPPPSPPNLTFSLYFSFWPPSPAALLPNGGHFFNQPPHLMFMLNPSSSRETGKCGIWGCSSSDLRHLTAESWVQPKKRKYFTAMIKAKRGTGAQTPTHPGGSLHFPTIAG